MILYAETSAALAWLLGEDAGQTVGRELGRAGCVVASELTWIEVERLLLRYEATRRIERQHAARLRKRFSTTAAAWEVVALAPDILERARGPFPLEPVRTLDAIHLASALACRELERGLEFLSLDRRCRANAQELGFRVLPTLGVELREPSGRRPFISASARSRRAERK